MAIQIPEHPIQQTPVLAQIPALQLTNVPAVFLSNFGYARWVVLELGAAWSAASAAMRAEFEAKVTALKGCSGCTAAGPGQGLPYLGLSACLAHLLPANDDVISSRCRHNTNPSSIDSANADKLI